MGLDGTSSVENSVSNEPLDEVVQLSEIEDEEMRRKAVLNANSYQPSYVLCYGCGTCRRGDRTIDVILALGLEIFNLMCVRNSWCSLSQDGGSQDTEQTSNVCFLQGIERGTRILGCYVIETM